MKNLTPSRTTEYFSFQLLTRHVSTTYALQIPILIRIGMEELYYYDFKENNCKFF